MEIKTKTKKKLPGAWNWNRAFAFFISGRNCDVLHLTSCLSWNFGLIWLFFRHREGENHLGLLRHKLTIRVSKYTHKQVGKALPTHTPVQGRLATHALDKGRRRRLVVRKRVDQWWSGNRCRLENTLAGSDRSADRLAS